MPRIWLKSKDGYTFHLTGRSASWEGDFNTPDNPVLTRNVLRTDRCVNEIAIQTENGIQLLNLAPEGRTGECVQCGQCCSHPKKSCPDPKGKCGYINKGKYHHVCPHLIEYPEKKGIGHPGGTSCEIYGNLLDGYKGCVLYPSSPDDMQPWMTACGMRFE